MAPPAVRARAAQPPSCRPVPGPGPVAASAAAGGGRTWPTGARRACSRTVAPTGWHTPGRLRSRSEHGQKADTAQSASRNSGVTRARLTTNQRVIGLLGVVRGFSSSKCHAKNTITARTRPPTIRSPARSRIRRVWLARLPAVNRAMTPPASGRTLVTGWSQPGGTKRTLLVTRHPAES